ncbi:MAG TPA: hypothetical protein ENN41_01860 [Sediminispirochaeta sp.]|nr:hypothetical protein [Sediminispirochaeta sp.]
MKKTLREKEVQNPEGIQKKEVDEKKLPCSSCSKPSWLPMVTRSYKKSLETVTILNFLSNLINWINKVKSLNKKITIKLKK